MTRFRIWRREDGLWCVSPDHGDGRNRRTPFIIARTLDRACRLLKKRRDRVAFIRNRKVARAVALAHAH